MKLEAGKTYKDGAGTVFKIRKRLPQDDECGRGGIFLFPFEQDFDTTLRRETYKIDGTATTTPGSSRDIVEEVIIENEPKFKIGDVVECIYSGYSTSSGEVGKKFTIVDIRYSPSIESFELKMKESRTMFCEWSNEKGFELVQPENLWKKWNDESTQKQKEMIDTFISNVRQQNRHCIITRNNQGETMNIDEIKPVNLVEAKKQFDLEKANAEVEYAKTQLRQATDSINAFDREIKQLEERKKPYLDIIKKFK